MITELLAIAALSRKLWMKGTLLSRIAAVAVWVVFGAVVPFIARFLEEHLPTAVLIAMPITTVTTTVTVKLVQRRRTRRLVAA